MLCWHYRHIFKKNGELCIKACQLVLKTTKTTYLLYDHDKVKGNKLTCFCIDTLVSNSELCSVDISHYNAYVGSEKLREGLSNPSILSIPWTKIFHWVNSQQPAELNNVIATSLPVCGRNETRSNVIALWWTPHRMYCSRIPSCQVEKWEIVPFML